MRSWHFVSLLSAAVFVVTVHCAHRSEEPPVVANSQASQPSSAKPPATGAAAGPTRDAGADGQVKTSCPEPARSIPLRELWAKRFGHGKIADLAVDSDGSTVLVGTLLGPANFGTGPITRIGPSDIIAARLGPAGEHHFSLRLGDGSWQIGRAVVLDAKGNAYVLGVFRGALWVGSRLLHSKVRKRELGSLLLFKIDRHGKPQWAHAFSGRYGKYSGSVAVSADGHVVLGGSFLGTANFGGKDLVAQGAKASLYLARLDPQGKHLWSRSVGDQQSLQVLTKVAVDGQGRIYAVGYHRGRLDFGAGPMDGGKRTDVYVVRLAPDGSVQRQRHMRAPGQATVHYAEVSRQGSVVLLGQHSGEFELKPGTITAERGGFLVSLNTELATQRGWTFAKGGFGLPLGLAIDDRGHIVARTVGVFGVFADNISGLRTTDSIQMIDRRGCLLWYESRTSGSSKLAMNAQGALSIAGSFGLLLGTASGRPLQARSKSEMYVKHYAPCSSP